MAKLEQEAHRIAARALSQQEQALIELRSRTGTLLTAASLIASFLGGQALARNGLSGWVVLALLAFGASVVLCIYVLLPKSGLVFALDAPKTYNALYEVRADDGEVDRRLAYWLRFFGDRLDVKLDGMGTGSKQPVSAEPPAGSKPPPPPPPPPPGVGIPETRGGGQSQAK